MRNKVTAIIILAAASLGAAAISVPTPQGHTALTAKLVKPGLHMIMGSSDNVGFLEIAEVIPHRNARANMVKGNQPAPPRVVFSEQTSVHLGGTEVHAYHLGRGHTNGDAVIYFPDLKAVHAGDLVVGSTPFIDYASGGSSTEWINTLDRILELDFDTVIPGHGDVMTKEDVRSWKTKFETLRERMAELVRQGVKKEDVRSRLRTDDPGWPLQPDGLFVRRSLPNLYDELAGC